MSKLNPEQCYQFHKLNKRLDDARKALEQWQLDIRSVAPFAPGDFVSVPGGTLWLQTFKIVEDFEGKLCWELRGQMAKENFKLHKKRVIVLLEAI